MGTRPRKKVKKKAVAAAPPRPAAAPPLPRRALRVVVVCYLFLALLYAVKIPFGNAPDETAHLRYLDYLAQHHRLPVFQAVNPGSDYEFHQPPLYYVLALPAYLMTQGPPEVKGQTVRFFSLLLGLALLYLTFLLARSLLPDRPWTALAAAGLVAFLPMHLHMAASIGNDVLTEVWFAAVLVLLVGYLRAAAEHRTGGPAPSYRTVLWVGAFLGLGMLTKSLAVLLFPVAWFAFALAARGPEGFQWRRLGRDLLLCTAVALVICGWWLARNQVRYGDPLAQRAFMSAFVGSRPSPHSFIAQFHARTGATLTAGQYDLIVVGLTAASALGMFGPIHGNEFAFYPTPLYEVVGAVALLALIGFVVYLRRERPRAWQAWAWLCFGLLGALLLASFIRFNFSFFQAQARYLFPALPPAALAVCLGLEQYAPPARRHWLSLVVAAALGVLALAGLSLWIVPQFSPL